MFFRLAPVTNRTDAIVLFFEHFLTFWDYKILWAHLVYSLPQPYTISPRFLGYFSQRMILETKIWALRVLIAAGVLLLLGPLVPRKYILTHIFNHITAFLSIHMCLYEAKREFLLVSWTLLQYHVVPLAFPPCLSVTPCPKVGNLALTRLFGIEIWLCYLTVIYTACKVGIMMSS